MLMTLFSITGMLYLLRYFAMTEAIVFIISQPIWVYGALATLFLILRICIAVYNAVPAIRRFFKSLERVSNNSSAILQRLDSQSKTPKGGSRSFSTSSVTRAKKAGALIPSSSGVAPLTKKNESDETATAFKKAQNVFFIKDVVSAVRIRSVNVNAMISVKGGVWWVNKVVRLLPSIGLSTTGARVRAIVVILQKFSSIASSQGIKGLVIHLKACHVCLTQACAGHMIKDTGLLKSRVSRTNRGLPRLILAQDRSKIRQDDFQIIKFYQTMFGIYRILDFKGVLNFKSIVQPFTGSMEFIVGEILPMVPIYVDLLIKKFPKGFPERERIESWVGITKKVVLGRPNFINAIKAQYADMLPMWLAKSAIGTRTRQTEEQQVIEVSSHPLLMLQTARFIRESSIFPDFKRFLSLFPVNAPFTTAFEAEKGITADLKPLPSLGKIGIKVEAAGKVRLFAMVPTWFQNLLAPLHKLIFNILGEIPQDGTFDQLKPLKQSSSAKMSFSLDLTAATDRLPLIIQTYLLGELLKDMGLATSWANLLTKIDYTLKNQIWDVNEKLKYSVGQPMGALSSWAMLAFTHHFLVQVSAWRAGVVPVGTWFSEYAILGDDLVIFNRAVATEYVRVIRKIGMEIGLHKSVLSRKFPSLEFAKRIFHKGADVSAVPFSEFFAGLAGFQNILEFARKYKLSRLDIARTLGFRFRALSKVNHGFNSLNLKLKQLFIAASLPTSVEEVRPFLMQGAPKVAPWPMDIKAFFEMFTLTERRKLLVTLRERHNALLNSLEGFIHMEPDIEGNTPLIEILGKKSTMMDTTSSEVRQISDLNWTSGPAIAHTGLVGGKRFEYVVLGPAELKEIKKGFVMIPDGIWQPIKVRPTKEFFKEELSLIPRKANLSEQQIKEFRIALSRLWDFQILPLRSKLMARFTELSSLLVKDWTASEEVAEAFMAYLDIFREVAMVASSPVSFKKIAPLARSSDPLSIRLWKRWSKFIQGTVSPTSVGTSTLMKDKT
jgi:hypothetical protein